MGQSLEVQIRRLQEFYWSDADPGGRGFVPLADALRKSGDFGEARRLLREGLSRYPDYLSAHVVSAWLCVDQGKIEEAESRFRSALELDPRNLCALRGLAQILADREELTSALDLLEVLRQEDPVDMDLPDRIRELRDRIQALQEAEAQADEVVEPVVWEDREAAAQELDWDAATLQPDSPREGGVETEEEEEVVPVGEEEVVPVEAGEEVEAEAEDETAPVVEEEPTPLAEDETSLVEEEPAPLAEDETSLVEEEPTPLAQEEPTPVVEDGEPIPSLGDLDNALVTPTLGEIFLRQGLYDRATGVFETLLEEDPGNDQLRTRLHEIRDLMETPAEEADPVSIESLAPDEVVPVDAQASDEVVPIDELAPGEGVSVDALAPDEGVVSVDALAPDEVVSVDALAPDEVVPIDELAPEEGVVPIESLAPDRMGFGQEAESVPIESLAPDEVVSADALAPDPSSEGRGEELAAGAAADEAEPEKEDSTIEAFEDWLKNLQ